MWHSHPANGADVSSRRWRLVQKKRGTIVARAHHIIYKYIYTHVRDNTSFCRIARQITNANACGSDEIFLMEGGRRIHAKLYKTHNSFIILFIISRHTMQRLYVYTPLTLIRYIFKSSPSKDDGASFTDNVRICMCSVRGGERFFLVVELLWKSYKR